MYLRLADRQPADRTGFLRVAATAMRHILIDHARGKHAAKRPGRRLPLDAVGSERAQEAECYQTFKFKVIASLQEQHWELTREAVLAWHKSHVEGSAAK